MDASSAELLPLSGVTVVDFSSLAPGPLATLLLAAAAGVPPARAAGLPLPLDRSLTRSLAGPAPGLPPAPPAHRG